MMLYILRHATAEEAASSGDDGARKLTERSKEKMRGAASGLRAMGLKFDVILTSRSLARRKPPRSFLPPMRTSRRHRSSRARDRSCRDRRGERAPRIFKA